MELVSTFGPVGALAFVIAATQFVKEAFALKGHAVRLVALGFSILAVALWKAQGIPAAQEWATLVLDVIVLYLTAAGGVDVVTSAASAITDAITGVG